MVIKAIVYSIYISIFPKEITLKGFTLSELSEVNIDKKDLFQKRLRLKNYKKHQEFERLIGSLLLSSDRLQAISFLFHK